MSELLAWVYRILRSKVLGVMVILALAVVALVGTMIMQAPAEARGDDAAYAQFLEQVRPAYGGWTPVLSALGIFQVWTSPLFISLAVLLGLSIIACTVNRVPLLIQRAFHPRTHVSPRFFEHAQYRAELDLPMEPVDALEHAATTLRKRGFRILADEKTPTTGLYADRFRFGPFGTAVAHASFLVIMAAFAISAFGGVEDTLDVGIGETVPVRHGTDLTLTATSFEDSYDDQGRPLDYVSHLVVRRGDAVLGEADVRVNSPLEVEGIAFHQASFGTAAQVAVSDAAGQLLYSGALPLNWTSDDGQYAIGRVALAEQGVEVMVVTPASGAAGAGIPAGDAVVEVYAVATGERLLQQPVQPGGVASTDQFSVTFLREQLYTGVMIRQDPGAPWMWVGSALLIIGMTMTFGFRHRRLWVRVDPSGEGTLLRLASAEQDDSTFERQFRTMVAVLDATAPQTTTKEDSHA